MSDIPIFTLGEEVIVIGRSNAFKTKIAKITPTGKLRIEMNGNLFDAQGRWSANYNHQTIVKLDDPRAIVLLKKQNLSRLKNKLLQAINEIDDIDLLARVESVLNTKVEG